jgi:hypothetical protein
MPNKNSPCFVADFGRVIWTVSRRKMKLMWKIFSIYVSAIFISYRLMKIWHLTTPRSALNESRCLRKGPLNSTLSFIRLKVKRTRDKSILLFQQIMMTIKCNLWVALDCVGNENENHEIRDGILCRLQLVNRRSKKKKVNWWENFTFNQSWNISWNKKKVANL